jgi:hypothetical protein
MVRRVGPGQYAEKGVVNVLNPEIDEAMKAPRVDDRLISQGPIPVGSNAADFAAFMKSEN